MAPTIYDVAGMRMREPEVCRVQGLASAAGKPLNGLCGKVLSVQEPRDVPAEERLPVKLDGIPDLKSLKRANLDIAPQATREIGVGVGREELQGFGTNPTQPWLGELFVGATDRQTRERWLSEDVPDAATRVCGLSLIHI